MPTLMEVDASDEEGEELVEVPTVVEPFQFSKQERDTIRRRHHRDPRVKIEGLQANILVS